VQQEHLKHLNLKRSKTFYILHINVKPIFMHFKDINKFDFTDLTMRMYHPPTPPD